MIVPLFALANAGLVLSGDLLGRAFTSPLVIGIILWLGGQPLSVGWPSLIAASSVAGIGFTMSLLIAELSYVSPLLDEAKLGILAASLAAAGLSIAMFYGLSLLPRELLGRSEAKAAPPVIDLADAVDPVRDHVQGRTMRRSPWSSTATTNARTVAGPLP